PKAYILRFGTWSKALQAFIDRVNADAPEVKPAQHAAGRAAVAARWTRPEADRREIKLGLRYTVLTRDPFRCVFCGRSPATEVGLSLHVDHIVSVADGGKTVYET